MAEELRRQCMRSIYAIEKFIEHEEFADASIEDIRARIEHLRANWDNFVVHNATVRIQVASDDEKDQLDYD